MTDNNQYYFSPNEILKHCSWKDCWVSYLGKVYDLTRICEKYGTKVETKRIIESAGKDVSTWTKEEDNNEVNRMWMNKKEYLIGCVTKRTMQIRLLNTLTKHEHMLEVCCEDTVKEVMRKYSVWNNHGGSYVWKHLGKKLDLNLTLEQNGVKDEQREFQVLDMKDELYTPCIMLYFSDDLTIN